jgi:plastocyanin
MAFKGILLAFFLLAVSVYAQDTTASFSVVQDNLDQTEVGTWSEYVFITTNENPITPVTITFNVDNAGLQIEPASLTFNPTDRALAFRAFASVADVYVVTFNVEPQNGQFFDLLTSVAFEFGNRSIELEQLPGESYVNVPSEPLQLTVSTAPNSDLVFSPILFNPALTFNPNPIVIKAGTRSARFTFTASEELNSEDFRFDISGHDNLYEIRGWTEFNTTRNFNVVRRPIDVTETTEDVFLGAPSGQKGFYVYARVATTGSFTVAPSAAGVTFNPASQTIDSAHQFVHFNYTATAPAANRDVYVTVTGAGNEYYEAIQVAEISVPKRRVTVRIAESAHVLHNATYMTVSIPAPVTNDLTVTFTAANVVFNVSSVQFTAANNMTSFTVAIKPIAEGPDTIYFVASGTDVAWFEEISSVGFNAIERATFITPSQYRLPTLWVGVESEKIPIRASVSPISSVTLTPTAPNLVFSPASLTFRNGSEQQWFTIRPLYTNNYSGSTPRSYTTQIDWLITGDDYMMFNQPSSATVTVNQRYFQTAWSSHLWTDDSDTYSTRHLHKTYKVWISTNYIGKGEHVSLTPVSPYWRFKPAVLHFNEKTTRVEVEATVTGLGSNGVIDYVIGGRDGGLYSPVDLDDDDNFDLALRPLRISAAVVSPDERTRASIYVADNRTARYNCEKTGCDSCYPCAATPYFSAFDTSVLSNNHVRSFLVRSFVLPDRELTITPRSPHVKFSPSKITLKAGNAVKRIDLHTEIYADDVEHPFNATGAYAEANFTATAEAPGTHIVTFELSGDDAQYYVRIPPTSMTFRTVHRAPSESGLGVSSSSFLFPSFVVVAVMAAFALVL